MKLAEALMQRSDYQTKLEKIKFRVSNNVKVQEGEEVHEDPTALLAEMEEVYKHMEDLIKRINHTNNVTDLEPGLTLSAALTQRDILAKRRSAFDSILYESSMRQNRVSRSEIKYVTTVDVPALQRRVEQISKDFRQLETKIQAANWLVDLI